MTDQKARIIDCYNELEYDINIFETSDLCLNKFDEVLSGYHVTSDSDKLKIINAVKLTIESNINEFHKGEAHVNTILSLLQYFDNLSDILKNSSCTDKNVAIDDILSTMTHVCLNSWMSALNTILCTRKITLKLSTCIIVLADADVDSLVKSLWRYRYYFDNNHPGCGHFSILIQEIVKDKFIKLLPQEIESISAHVHGFLQKRHLDIMLKKTMYNIVSMWSEDVTLLKCWIANINATNISINSLYDFGTEPIKEEKLWNIPTKMFIPTMHEKLGLDFCGKFHNHFYDGKWKEPIDRMYICDNNKFAWAEANENDIEVCAKSALLGFNTWRSMSRSARIKCLQNLGKNIRNSGEDMLAEKIFEWTRGLVNVTGSVIQPENGEYELITTRQPIGVIMIFGTNKERLFMHLVQALVAGNAVMICSIPDEYQCVFKDYCEKLSPSGFPPNVVIYLLNCTCTKESLRERLASERFLVCTDEQISNVKYTNDDELIKILQRKYTLPKHVYMPLMPSSLH